METGGGGGRGGGKQKQTKGRRREKGAPLKFVFKSSFRPLCRRVIQILRFDCPHT